MTADQNRLFFEAGRAAVNRGWSNAEVISLEALEDQTPAGPPLIVALTSIEVSSGIAKDLSALAGAGRRVLLVTDQPLPDDVVAWLPADSWVVVDSRVGPVTVEVDGDRQIELRVELLEALLSGTESDGVQRYLAGDRNTPHRILARLTTATDGWTIGNLAGNPSAPRTFLDRLLDANGPGMSELAQNPVIPLPQRQEVMRRIARDLIAGWVADEDTFDNDFLSLNVIPDVPRDVLEVFDEEGYLFGEWIYSESIPADLLLKIFNEGGTEPYQKQGFARRSSTPERVLRELASSENWYIREWAAMPCDAPIDVLTMLAGDASEYGEYVRMQVAENPSTPVEALIRLLNDPNESVRTTAAINPSLPAHLAESRVADIAAIPAADGWVESIDAGRISEVALTVLAHHPEPRIRSAVAACTATLTDTLAALATDEDSAVRWGVPRNRNAPAGLRSERLRADMAANGGSTTNVHAAREIARQEGCPDEVLRVLARDSDAEVRAAVIVNPATPLGVLEAMANSH